MRFYNLEGGDHFTGFTWTVEIAPVSIDYVVRMSVRDHRLWAEHTGIKHLAQTLGHLPHIIDNPVDLALTGAIRIQLLDTPHEKGCLLIGMAGNTRERSVADQLDDYVDGIRGDIYRYQHANTGDLIRAHRRIDLGLRFERGNGPIVDLIEKTTAAGDAFR